MQYPQQQQQSPLVDPSYEKELKFIVFLNAEMKIFIKLLPWGQRQCQFLAQAALKLHGSLLLP